MLIVVTYTWAPDPREASVGADGSMDFSRARPSLSDDDAVAIAVGRRLADALGAELVGLTLGEPDAVTTTARKSVLAHGLDRAVALVDPAARGLETTQTALILADAVRRLGDVGLVLAGDAAADSAARILPAVLAGALGWPCLLECRGVKAAGASVTLAREGMAGPLEVMVPLPAVLGVATDAAQPHLPGMRDLLGAGRRPFESSDAPAPAPVTAAEVLRRRPPAPKRRREIVPYSPDAATRLVGALRGGGVL